MNRYERHMQETRRELPERPFWDPPRGLYGISPVEKDLWLGRALYAEAGGLTLHSINMAINAMLRRQGVKL